MTLRDVILNYVEEEYGNIEINEELEEKIQELSDYFESASLEENTYDDSLEYHGDMDIFNDED